MATIKEIAGLAGVSSTTVSRVLNYHPDLVVSDEVRQRVFRIAHQLQYVPPKMRRLAPQQQVTIGIADWHIIRSDRPNVRLSTLGSLSKQVASSLDITYSRIEYGVHQPLDGVIAFGSFSEEEKQFLRSLSYRIVVVDSHQRDYQYDGIMIDFSQGIRELVAYLVEDRQYRTIGYIGGTYQSGTTAIGFRRISGLTDMLEQRGMYDPHLFHIGQISRESGYHMARQAIATGTLGQVMLLGNDEVAQGALEAFAEAALRIPQDVAVVVYQDIQTQAHQGQDYTTVRMYPDRVWEKATALLTDRIVGSTEDTMVIYIPPKLLLGRST